MGNAFGRGNLYEERNIDLLTAVQDSLHAHVPQRDVDYVVKNGIVEMVDQFKGRIAQDRRCCVDLRETDHPFGSWHNWFASGLKRKCKPI